MSDSSSDTALDAALVVGLLTFAMCVWLGFGPWSNSWVKHRHAQFSPSQATVVHKSNLVGGNQDRPDHYRAVVRFRNSIGEVTQREVPISYKLKNRPLVRVYVGPGKTFDIPADFEGAHPRNPSLFIPKAVSAVGGLIAGFIVLMAMVLIFELSEKIRNRIRNSTPVGA